MGRGSMDSPHRVLLADLQLLLFTEYRSIAHLHLIDASHLVDIEGLHWRESTASTMPMRTITGPVDSC